MKCKNQKWENGYKSYGDNVPGYAQGAYFPGDEPGIHCTITGDICPCDESNDPKDCTEYEELNVLCPECETINLIENEAGIIYCPTCGETWLADKIKFTVKTEDYLDLAQYKRQIVALKNAVKKINERLLDCRAELQDKKDDLELAQHEVNMLKREKRESGNIFAKMSMILPRQAMIDALESSGYCVKK